jgi:nitrite reductase (NADH) large subunit
MKYLIIGHSAAGVGALEAIRHIDPDSPITVISRENEPVYSRCLLSYYLADTLTREELLFRPSDFFRKLKAEIVLGQTAVSVDPNRKSVLCEDGTVYGYDKLLIATGSTAKIPDHLDAAIEGVSVLRTLADAVTIKERIERARHAVVLGGGLVGLKAAFGLRKAGLDVSVVVRSGHVLSQMIDKGGAEIVQKILVQNGIRPLTGSDVTKVISKAGSVETVEMEGGAEGKLIQPCDILVVAKGVRSNTRLIEGTAIEKEWGIITDSNMSTSVTDIYAAGDVAETFDIALERRSGNALWTCAVQQGRIAGFNMAGVERHYDGSVSMNSINFPGVDLISFGVVRPEMNAGYEVIVDSRPESNIYKKIVLKENRIKGLILINRIDQAGVLLSLLGRKVDISDLKSVLLSDRFSYADVLRSGGDRELSRYLNAGQPVRSE